jgi:transposase
MTKDSTGRLPKMTAGLDLGDKHSYLCLIDTVSGQVLEEGRLRTTPEALGQRFEGCEPMRIAIEVGTHSPWVSRLLEERGHEVLVANARKLRLIHQNKRKTDKIDAENLARLARLDPKLLAPLEHRDEHTQAHLALLRSREALVDARTQLVNHVRGSVKAFGARLPKCSTESFHKKAAPEMPEELEGVLKPVLETIASLSARIRDYDKRIEQIAAQRYPETELLRQIRGAGTLTALAFVLTLEDPNRFKKSVRWGPTWGLLRPRGSRASAIPSSASARGGARC